VSPTKVLTGRLNSAMGAVLHGDIEKFAGGNAPLARMLHEMKRRNAIAPQAVYQQTAIEMGQRSTSAGKARAVWDAVLAVWSAPFSLMEEANRYATAAATFDLAYEQLVQGDTSAFDGPKGLLNTKFGRWVAADDAQRSKLTQQLDALKLAQGPVKEALAWEIATDFAELMIQRTQFLMTRENRMALARNIGAPIMTFRSFPFLWLEMFIDLKPKQQIQTLTALLFLSGLPGLPMAGDAEDILDTFLEWMGKQPQYTSRMSRKLGEEVTDFIGMKGDLKRGMMQLMAGGITNVDALGLPYIGSRVSMGDIVPSTTVLQISETDKLRAFMELFGVGSRHFQDILRASENVAAGEFWRASRVAMPAAIKYVMQAAEAGEKGYMVDSMGKKIAEVKGADVAWLVAGFRPSRIAQMQEFNADWGRQVRYHQVRSSTLKDRIAQGRISGDADKVATAWDQVYAWNASHPMMPISLTERQIQDRVQTLTTGAPARLAERTPVALRPALAEEQRRLGF
jgi:hypothetical protein